jgi:hypothetical protein
MVKGITMSSTFIIPLKPDFIKDKTSLLNDLNQCYQPTATIEVECMKVLLHVQSLAFWSYAVQCDFEFLMFVLCTGEEELIWTQGGSVLRLYMLYWYSRFCACRYRDCWVCFISLHTNFPPNAAFFLSQFT